MTSQPPYEVFEHTADIGLRVYGRTLAELFIHAAQGMESLVVAPEQVRPQVGRPVSVQGHDAVALLIAWLSELIVFFDTEYLLFKNFEIVDMTETHLRAWVVGEAYDADRHELSSAIKAVTWHEAAIERSAEGYTASIIFDI
jgi:SHS2 domain-containing protein